MIRKLSLLLLTLTLASPALLTPAPALATDLSITVANVKPLAQSTTIKNVRAGETITQGMPVYRKSADNEYYKCQADGTADEAACVGIAISAGSDGTYMVIVTGGELDLGATLTVGTQYFVSAAAGGIAPGADLATSDYITSLGTVATSGKLIVNIDATGYEKP